MVASLAAVNVPSYTTAAAASAASAAASYDSFDDRYLGAKAANPTLDNDGNALLTGALYWNTAANEMRAYSGSAWVVTYNPSVSAVSSFGVGARTGSVVLTASDLATSVFGPFTALASAATTDLSTITTVGASITGTTTITAFAGNNLLRVVKFAGILTLTYNATTLILPGAASITTAAGDTAIVLTDASGNATVVTYTRAANAPLTYATAAEYRANTANRILTTDKVWTAADIVTLTDAATITPDFSTGFDFTVTLGGNRTIANPTNTKNGQGGVLYVKQDATGSRTASWGTNWKWSSGTAPTLTTTASRTDKIFYKVESATIIHASIERDSR